MAQLEEKENISTTVKLNDGVEIPVIGLGTYVPERTVQHMSKKDLSEKESQDKKKEDELLYASAKYALEIGYRHIDTAQVYDTERIIKNSIQDSKVKREDIFITSKLPTIRDVKKAKQSIEESLKLLDVDYIDLYLIHSPITNIKGDDAGKDVIECYKGLLDLKEEGKLKSVGVSNFNIDHLRAIEAANLALPSVNQIEIHPFLIDEDLVAYCNKKNIKIEAYSPIAQGKKLDHDVLKKLASKYKKTSAQIMLKWGLQRGFIILPKSSNFKRIKENVDLFDFTLSDEDIDKLNKLKSEKFRCCWNVIETVKWGKNVIPSDDAS